MVFGALDFWYARCAPPVSRPSPGEPLFGFIVRRLIQSWHIPAGVARYYYWMNLPDHDLATRTITGQWPRIRARIDAGVPAPLGVVTVASPNPLLLGHNHQVLAYGYRLDGTQVTLMVYDPNSGPADDVQIGFDTAAPAAIFTHCVNIGWPVRGFFLTAYSPAAPPGNVRPRR